MDSSANAVSDPFATTPVSRTVKPRRGKYGLIAGGAIAVVIAGYLYLDGSAEAEVDRPLVATVAIGSIENTISSAGTLKPSTYVDVGAQVSGLLEKLYVDVGDLVEEGQLLAEIDARTQESRVEASRAAIEAQESQILSREALLALAKTNAERQERLKAADATSQLEYDTAISNLASAEAALTQLQKQIVQARASLESEETQLEFTRIYAPIAGTVVSVEMNEGRTLNANQQAPTLLRIADLSTMTVEAEISEADVGSLEKGMNIYFTTLSGGTRRWHGALRQILPTPTIENNVVLYTGLFDVDNSDSSLLPEMTAQVFFITSAARNVLTVPVGALTYSASESPAAVVDVSQAAPDTGITEGARARDPQRPPLNGDNVREPRAGGGFRGERRPVVTSDSTAPRAATVTVVNSDGTEEQRRVEIGVSSRVTAEVISGLSEGEQVKAGIIQNANTSLASTGQSTQRFGGIPGGF